MALEFFAIRIGHQDRVRLDMMAGGLGTSASQLARAAIYDLLQSGGQRGAGLDLVAKVAAARRREARASMGYAQAAMA